MQVPRFIFELQKLISAKYTKIDETTAEEDVNCGRHIKKFGSVSILHWLHWYYCPTSIYSMPSVPKEFKSETQKIEYNVMVVFYRARRKTTYYSSFVERRHSRGTLYQTQRPVVKMWLTFQQNRSSVRCRIKNWAWQSIRWGF